MSRPTDQPAERGTEFRDTSILLALSVALAAGVGLLMHFSAPVSPARMQVLNDLIAGRPIAYTPYPVGYFEFAAFAMRHFPRLGLVAGQGAMYVLTVLLSYGTLKKTGARGAFPLTGAILVALYPNLLFGITRFQDTEISCFFLAAFAWLVMRLRESGVTAANAALSGGLFGIMILVRPNAVTLIPVALWAAFSGRRWARRDVVATVASFALATLILAAGILPVKDKFTVFDKYYGAYTLANGTHEHALEGIMRDYNGEMTMPLSLHEAGLPVQGLERSDNALAGVYTGVALRFIREHPGRYVQLELFKLINLFRPDFRNTERSGVPRVANEAMHTLIAAIFFVWLLVRVLARRVVGIDGGFLMIPLLVFYLAPFVATNSDPRYRFPVDALLILDAVYCITRLTERTESA